VISHTASMTASHLFGAPLLSGSRLLWYTTRATGIVALLLLTGTVILGVVGTARAASARWPRLVTAGLHRNLALISIALVGVHVLTTVLDPFASIGLAAAFIPFDSAYRPLWLSLGTVAFDLLLAVLITSLLRDRLSSSVWRAVHLLVYLSWPIALWHGLGTGTDTRLPWILGIDVVCVAAVGWAIWWRLSLTTSPTIRTAGLLTLTAAPLLTLVFVLWGPLQPGWARRAGTPVKLLGSAGRAVARHVGGGQRGALVNARFRGHLSVTGGPSQRTITITGRTLTEPAQAFVIVLRGTPSGSGVNLTGGTVRIGRPGTAAAYSGPVVRLAGQELVAAVSGEAGQRQAQFTMTIKGAAVTGTVSLRTATGE
jgi:methionine sulfoxide reductase heme-binding subunit